MRNNQSLAHDNPILNYDEALLIFNHVAGSMRFLRSLKVKSRHESRHPLQPIRQTNFPSEPPRKTPHCIESG